MAAYTQLLVAGDNQTQLPQSPLHEQLPAAFYESFPAVFIGRRGVQGDGVWPEHSGNSVAVGHYKRAQLALHEQKDAVAAIQEYEKALDADPMYLQAWVGLGIACISDNTKESLERAEGIFTRLCAIEPGEWLRPEVASILQQNLAYISVHRYRQSEGHSKYEVAEVRALLEKADNAYTNADRLAETVRIEMLCPWTYVKLEKGEIELAQQLWKRILATNPPPTVLNEYVAKYGRLKELR